MYYFAYGSNLSTRRLQARVAAAVPVGRAVLSGHSLRFHKRGRRDRTGKCDAWCTGSPADAMHGAVYAIPDADRSALDEHEGLHHGYEEKQVEVMLADGTRVSAFTYYATDIDPGLTPLDWYLHHVITGALEHALPEPYVRELASVVCDADPDSARKQRELSVYR